MPANYNQKFLAAFKGYEECYVIIGGTATSIVLAQQGLESRRTPDYDIVLTNQRTKAFYQVFTQFIKDGNYVPENLDEKGQLYRFKTNDPAFPKMIELFCKLPDFPLQVEGRTTPVSFEEASLSALLLDDDYYQLVLQGAQTVDGYSILKDKSLIVLKAKAWLDLSKRKNTGAQVDSKNIKKHLNDIARLCGALEDTEKFDLSPTIQTDMNEFLSVLAQRMYELPGNERNKDILLSKEKIFQALTALLGQYC